jgi:hypothetical protein
MDAAVGCFALAQSAPPLLGIFPVSSDGQLQNDDPFASQQANAFHDQPAERRRPSYILVPLWPIRPQIPVMAGRHCRRRPVVGRFRLLDITSARDRGQPVGDFGISPPRLALCHGAVGSHQCSSTRWSRLIATVLAGMMMDRLALSIRIGS